MKNMLSLVKNRASARRYSKKNISSLLLNKIIDAGIWGPSVFGRQPYKFILIKDKLLIKKISDIVFMESRKLEIGGRAIANSASKTLSNANALIAIYNSKEIAEISKRFGKCYARMARMAEIEVIGAAIQNMLLVAESLGVGSCWFDIPLIAEKKISKLLNLKYEFIAILSLGYCADVKKRSKRKKEKIFLGTF